MRLIKILVRYFPPGIGLEYVQNGETKNKMVDLFQLTESTDVEDLANQLMKTERMLTKGTRPYLVTTLIRLRSKLKDDVRHKFHLHKTMEHILPITNVKFNKEGSKCLTGSFDRTCKIWNTTSGNLTSTLEGHTGVVFDVTFNYPFDDRIISASFDKTAIVWDGETGEKLATLWGHTEEVVVVQYDYNNHLIATGSMDHSGKIFDLQTGVELWVVDGHEDALVALEFSSDGKYLLSGSFDSNVYLWDTRTHSKVGWFCGHEDSISRCLFNYDTTLVATGSIDRTAKIWDRRNLKECFALEHEDEGEAVQECREKCKPLNCARAKGRIFFNIEKESYANVLKMRSIDNVFLVSEAFEELKLKKIKDEDLLTIKNLVEQVDWGKSVPEWAEIVKFKGVQFPKCAQKGQHEPLDENEPACQNCQKNKTGGGGDLAQSKDGGGSSAKNGVTSDESLEKYCDSPKVNLVFDEEVFQTPPDKCAPPKWEKSEPTKDHSSDGDKMESAQDKDDSALESSLPKVHLPEAHETDDESAFHSAEEELLFEEPVGSSPAPGVDNDQLRSAKEEILDAKNDSNAQQSASEEIRSNAASNEPIVSSQVVREIPDPKQGKYEKMKAKQAKRREVRDSKRNMELAKSKSDGTAKPVEGSQDDPECESHGFDKTDSTDATSQNGSEPVKGPVDQSNPKAEKKKSYWQRRREAKAKKAAEAEAAKPPRKPYIDDGIMKFRVTCYRNGPKHSFDSNDAAGHFGGFINDKFHWTVDLTRHDINVVLVVEGDSAYVTLALTKKSLHKRNIKHFGPTTLRATLCYGLLCLGEPKVGDIVMDPMCGGGSISIEGALAFSGTYHICGDVNAKCVAATGDNIVHNSKEKPLLVDALQWSVRRLPLKDQSIDVFVTDLPFGLRVGKQKDNTGLYTAALIEVARVVRTCGRASLLTYDRTAMIRALQRTRHLWREIRVNMVNQGGLRCFAYLLLRRAIPSLADSAVPVQGRELIQEPLSNFGNPGNQETQPECLEDAPLDCATPELMSEAPQDCAASGIMSEAPLDCAAPELMSQAPLNCATSGLIPKAPLDCTKYGLTSESPLDCATSGLTSEAPQDCATPELMSEVPQDCATSGLMSQAPQDCATPELMSEVPQDCATSGLMSQAPQDCATPELVPEAPLDSAMSGLKSEEPLECAMPELMSERIRELDLQDLVIPEPNELIAESPNARPDSEEKCSEDTKCA